LLKQAAESLGAPLGQGELPLDLSDRNEKRERDLQRLREVMRYAYERGCRTRFIVDYFRGRGVGKPVSSCGTCDLCAGVGAAPARALDEDETLEVRIALSAIARLNGRFGAQRIAQVLTGSKAREVLHWGLDKLPTYAKLEKRSIGEVQDLLGLLADAGLVQRVGVEGAPAGAFVLSLTEEGAAVMKGEVLPELPLPERRTSEPAEGLLDALRAWRREEARRRRVPAYRVLTDRTLSSIAAERPADARALSRVHGIGPSKLEAFGEDILCILHQDSTS
jgi:ATP-dependent DNA helicase RecQ